MNLPWSWTRGSKTKSLARTKSWCRQVEQLEGRCMLSVSPTGVDAAIQVLTDSYVAAPTYLTINPNAASSAGTSDVGSNAQVSQPLPFSPQGDLRIVDSVDGVDELFVERIAGSQSQPFDLMIDGNSPSGFAPNHGTAPPPPSGLSSSTTSPYQVVIYVPMVDFDYGSDSGGAAGTSDSVPETQEFKVAAPPSTTTTSPTTTPTSSNCSPSSGGSSSGQTNVTAGSANISALSSSASPANGQNSAIQNTPVATTVTASNNVAAATPASNAAASTSELPIVAATDQVGPLSPTRVDQALTGNNRLLAVSASTGNGAATTVVGPSAATSNVSASVEADEGGAVDLLMTTPDEFAIDPSVLDLVAGMTDEAGSTQPSTGDDSGTNTSTATADQSGDSGEANAVAAGAAASGQALASNSREGGMVELDANAAVAGERAALPDQYAAIGPLAPDSDTALGRYQAFELATYDPFDPALALIAYDVSPQTAAAPSDRMYGSVQMAIADFVKSPKATVLIVTASSGYLILQRRTRRRRKATEVLGMAPA